MAMGPFDCADSAEEADMGQFVNMDGEEASVIRLVTTLLQEDVTYEFIAHIAKCPVETVKEIAANTKYNKE